MLIPWQIPQRKALLKVSIISIFFVYFFYYNSYHYSTVPYNNFVFLGKDGNTDDAVDAVDKIISKLHIDGNFNAYLNDEAVQASTVI